jgi:hypothetical protein
MASGIIIGHKVFAFSISHFQPLLQSRITTEAPVIHLPSKPGTSPLIQMR